MSESRKHDCTALLAHADWVRGLARHLVVDAHAADDLAQDALAAALVQPPPGDRPLRGWLAGVLRNLVRQARREEGNRGAREREAAREERDVSSVELLERLDSHRVLVEAVARLDEPYRSAILLRYFEGLAPAEIARRTGTQLRTVHTRLHRALARLRAELDRAHGGDREAWLLALLPYARGPGGWTAAATGALVMQAKWKLAAAALAVLGVCSTIVLWRGAASAGTPPLSAAPEALAQDGPRVQPMVDAPVDPSSVGERRPAETATPQPESEPAPEPVALLAGRVLDVTHAPVAGIRVRYRPREDGSQEDREGLTDATGAFALERPTFGGTLDVASPGWTVLFRPEFAGAPGARELVLVVAPSVTLGGRVVDEEGRGIESARVAVPLPFHLRARFDAILDGASSVERQTTTGPDGSFEFDGVPVVAGLELVTSRAALLEDRRALPAYDELALWIVLRRAAEDSGRLLGRVVDAVGEPVADAWVGMGEGATKSGAGGAFALELTDAERAAGERVLRAVKPGHLPAELRLARGDSWPEPLVLALGPPPFTIAGRVVDAFGESVPGAEVWTDEETHFGLVALEGGEMVVHAGASVEGLLRGDPWTHRVRADAGGRFELEGLQAREYRLLAFDRAHLALASARVAAGAHDALLRMPEEERFERVAGRVTSLAGEPLAGARVMLERPPLGDGPSGLLQGHYAHTDEDGRFEFERVARAVHALQVQGPELDLIGTRRVLGGDDDVERLELHVPLRVHVQIDAGEAAEFDRVALLDERGEVLQLSLDHGQHTFFMDEITLDHGRSESFSVSELATTLVLYANGAELRRVPVALASGALNTLRP